MSGAPNELVADFAAETEGHLEELEPLLLGAEWQTLSPEAVAASLRCFHSIKGLSRVLGVSALEKVAHDAETLLSRVRAKEMALDAQALDALLRALDAIRHLRGRFLAGETDLEAPADVIEQLAACCLGSGSASAQGAARASGPRPASELAGLHADTETLVCFGELLSESLSSLVSLLDPGASVEAHEEAQDTADMLHCASQKLELGALEAAFGTLVGAAPSLSPERAIEVAQVVVLVGRLERLLKMEAGSAALAAKAQGPLESCRRAEANALARFVADHPNELEPAESSVRRLFIFSQSLARNEAATAIAMSAVAAWRSACTPLQAGHLEALFTALSDDNPTQVKDAAIKLGALLSGSVDITKVATDRRIDTAKLSLLTPENRTRLSCLAEGTAGELFEVILDLPANSRALPQLVGWLSQQAGLLLGQPLAVDGRPRVALLLLSEHSVDSLAEGIAATTSSGVPTTIRKLDGSILPQAFGPPLQATSVEGGGGGDGAVRVPVEILDRLFGRVGEFFQVGSRLNALVFDDDYKTSMLRFSDYVLHNAPELAEDHGRIDRHFQELGDIEADIQKLINLIHDSTLGLRVIPFDILFGRFARLTHDLARSQKKMVRFEGLAEGIKIDKGMAELLADPLMHMIRNAIDHGIETPEERRAANKEATAMLRVTASQTGNRIMVDVADDGRGIDPDRVLRRAIDNGLVREDEAAALTKEQIYRFILLPGFSTAEAVTETSGRGVGMDVALVNITRLGGRLEIRSTPGQGTRFVIELPLSAAIQSVLLAEAGHQMLAFPERVVVQAESVPWNSLQEVNGQSAILLHGRYLPVFDLTRLLHLPENPVGTPEMALLILEYERHRIGVVVRRVLRRLDVLIRESHPRITTLPGIGGVSSLGNDRVVLVIDPAGLFDLARRSPGATLLAAAAVP